MRTFWELEAAARQENNMDPLSKLLAKIESKLTLVLLLASEYETRLPTVIARIKQAQAHLHQKEITALYLDLEWITKAMFSKKTLRRLGEHQIIDLQLLRNELGRYVTSEKSSSRLGAAIPRWRGRMLKALEHLEHDLIIVREKTAAITTYELARTIIDFQNAGEKIRDLAFVPPADCEQKIINLVSLLTLEMQTINTLLLEIKKVEMAQGFRRVLLSDWNAFIYCLEGLFKDAYREIQPAAAIRVVRSKEGIQELQVR